MQLPEQQPFSFHDQRQERIYRRLRLLGEGPAAFFRDACKMMDSPTEYRTTTHLVGHLMREAEAFVRDVLAPQVAEGDSKHRREIQGILRILGIPADHSVSLLWLSLPGGDGLQRWAHRDALLMPRPVDDRFQGMWDSLLVILDFVLENFEQNYLIYHKILDELIDIEHPTNADARRLTAHAPNNLVAYEYFFGKLNSTEWLNPLATEGLFRWPAPLERNDGTIRFVRWPQSRYLARVASDAPGVVADIILEIPNTDNISILADFADAACAIPPNHAVRLIDQAEDWASGPYASLGVLPNRMGRLIGHLAEGGYAAESLALAKVILALKSFPNDSNQPNDEGEYS